MPIQSVADRKNINQLDSCRLLEILRAVILAECAGFANPGAGPRDRQLPLIRKAQIEPSGSGQDSCPHLGIFDRRFGDHVLAGIKTVGSRIAQLGDDFFRKVPEWIIPIQMIKEAMCKPHMCGLPKFPTPGPMLY